MQESLLVGKGLEITTLKAVENVKCKFTTCHDVKMVPLEVIQVECHDTYQGSELGIKLKWTCQGEKESYDLEKLRLYLDGDTPLVSSLYQLFMNADEPLNVDFGHTNTNFNKKLPDARVEAAFIDQQSALLPNASTSHPGYALLHDYFNGRERFNFVDIHLGEQFSFPERFDDFFLTIKSPVKLPPGHKLGAGNIKLNCVVGINLFTQEAEPIRLEPNRTDYPVIPDNAKRHYVHTYSVDKVQGRDKLTAEESDYKPRYQSVFGDEQRLYTLNLKDIGAAVPSHYINLPVQHSTIDDTVSTKLTCYNGRWPKQTIREGQLSVGGKDMPQLLQVKNIARPSNYKTSHEFSKHWQLISLLNLKFSSLANVKELKQLLALFDWSGRGENKRRIESISAVKSKKFNRVKRGIFIQGSELCITLDESKFSCQADVYHFATMLHQFFVMYAPINQSIQTRIECIPSYKEFVWTVAPGQSAHI